jgi:glucokinase
MKTFAGIEIGGTKLQIVIGDEQANILQRFRYAVDASAGAEGIRSAISQTFKQLNADDIRGIGIGFGGPVDHKTGKIFTSYHIQGWSDFSITQWLTSLTGVFVSVDNDANVAALGEALFGAGRNYENVYYVTLGSGLGAGHVVNRKIYHGSSPGEMEMGHVRLDKSGRTVQSSCSGWAVDEKIRAAAAGDPKGALARLTKNVKGSESRYLIDAVNEGDQVASEILQSTMDDFAFALSHSVHLLHPQTVIMGGGLSLLGEPLRKLTEQQLSRYLMDAFQPGPDVQLSKLKEDAVPVGALALAIEQKQ